MSTPPGPEPRPSPSTLYRDSRRGMIKGVCAGLADYFGIETWVVRLIALVCLFVFPVPAVVAYVIAAVLLPKRPERLYRNDAEEGFWRGARTDPKRTFSELRHRFRSLEQRLRRMESYVTSREFDLKREIDDLDDAP